MAMATGRGLRSRLLLPASRRGALVLGGGAIGVAMALAVFRPRFLLGTAPDAAGQRLHRLSR